MTALRARERPRAGRGPTSVRSTPRRDVVGRAVVAALACALLCAADNPMAANDAAMRAAEEKRYCDAAFIFLQLYSKTRDDLALYRAAEVARAADDRQLALRLYRLLLENHPGAEKKDQTEQKVVDIKALMQQSGIGTACVQPPKACGDWIVAPGEACDDGNLVDGDACQSNCTEIGCGNGIVESGEQCDDAGANSDAPNADCRTDCTLRRCGDGIVDNREECEAPELGCDVDDCIFGVELCVNLQGGGQECFRDISGGLTHGFTERAQPGNGASANDPYFDDVVLDCAATVDTQPIAGTGTTTICGTAVAHQVSGAGTNVVVVFTMRTLSVASTADIRFIGNKSVAFAVYGDVVVANGGHLNADGLTTINGSSARTACAGGNGSSGEAGGAGGSHGSLGGAGAIGNSLAGGAPNAVTATNPHTILEGGCRGGLGGDGAGQAPAPGAGGALQISSGARVIIDGFVSSNGAGGNRTGDGDGGGPGGASGGDVYVQAVKLLIGATGSITAQGGGGGAGGDGGGGDNGSTDPNDVANGGQDNKNDETSGGNGAGAAGDDALNAAQAGESGNNSQTAEGAGGGGGGVGRITLDVADCTLVDDSRVSPQEVCQ